MLSREKRLNLSRDFKWVASGKKISTEHFRIMYRFKEGDYPLVGIALSKQNFRKANLRNQARRLTSGVVEEVYPRLRKDLNLVIMPKAEVIETPQDVLKEEISNVQDLFILN